MYYGIIGVSFIAFSCSTEFIPEINEKMKLVPFSTEFKTTMTAVMIIDYIGCWLVEQSLKWAFSDYRPKDIAVRRKDQIEREEQRKLEELEAKAAADEEKQRKLVESLEKKMGITR